MTEENRTLAEIQEAPDGGVSSTVVAAIMNQLMRPVLESMAQLLKNNTEAIEQIAMSQDAIRARMEAMEKTMRLQTPVTKTQSKYLLAAARERAAELLDKRQVTEKKAITKLSGAIRKAVLAEYGVAEIGEIPKHEYNVCLGNIRNWNDARTVLAIAREAREREEAQQ